MSELYEKSFLKLELDQVLQLLSQCAGRLFEFKVSKDPFLTTGLSIAMPR